MTDDELVDMCADLIRLFAIWNEADEMLDEGHAPDMLTHEGIARHFMQVADAIVLPERST